MKLNKNFITHHFDEKQQVMISVDHKQFSGLVKINETASFIIDLLKEDITEEEIVQKMLAEYNANEKVIRVDVRRVLETLEKIGAIDD